jgi:hypothetical protein
MNALDRYETATSENDKADAALDMYLASQLDENDLTAFLGTNKEEREKNFGLLRNAYVAATEGKDISKYDIAQLESMKVQEVADFMLYSGFKKELGSNKKYDKFVEELKDASEQEGDLSYEKVTKLAAKYKNDFNDKEEQFLNNTINGLFGREGSSDPQITDLFGKIGELLAAMTQLTTTIEPLVTDKRNSPSQPASNPTNVTGYNPMIPYH